MTISELTTLFLEDRVKKQSLFYIQNLNSFFSLQDKKYLLALDPFTLKKEIYSWFHLTSLEKSFNTMKINEVYNQLQYLCPTIDLEDDKYIVFKDFLLNTETFEHSGFDENKLSTFYLPYSKEEILKTECPNFMNFISSSIVEKQDTSQPDFDTINFVQEMMGYLLLPSIKACASFFLVGEGQNGKSTFAKIIRGIIGKKFTSALSLETLTTNRFALPSIIGKRVNICNEEESKFVSHSMFKALVGGDPITGEHKHGNHFDFEPRTKFMFCSNDQPTFSGLSHGLRRRIYIIPFFRIFTNEEQDGSLFEKIQSEFPGVIRWMLSGAKRLVENKYVFSKISTAMGDSMIEFENETSSALCFVREFYEVSETQFISNKDLYAHYTAWCRENGRNPMGSYNFGKDLMKNFKGIDKDCKKNNIRGKNLELKKDSVDQADIFDTHAGAFAAIESNQ